MGHAGDGGVAAKYKNAIQSGMLGKTPCHMARTPLYGALLPHSIGNRVTHVCGLPVMLKKENGMNANELRDKTPDQLREELVNLKKESFNLRFQQATGQLENTSGIRAARRNAAKVKTILNEKAAAAASEA